MNEKSAIKMFAAPPLWHAATAFATAAAVLLLVGWNLLSENAIGALLSLSLVGVAIFAGVEACTSRLWVDGDRIWIRDKIFRVRSFGISEIEVISFVPGESFFFIDSTRKRVRFPAGAKNLPEVARLFSSRVDQLRSVELHGVLRTDG